MNSHELPGLAEHQALVEQLPLRLQPAVAVGLLTVTEAENLVGQARAALAARHRTEVSQRDHDR